MSLNEPNYNQSKDIISERKKALSRSLQEKFLYLAILYMLTAIMSGFRVTFEDEPLLFK